MNFFKISNIIVFDEISITFVFKVIYNSVYYSYVTRFLFDSFLFLNSQ